MKVKLSQKTIDKEFRHPTAFSTICESLGRSEVDVIAIMKSYGRCSYLILVTEAGGWTYLEWIGADKCDIVDKSIPYNWINNTWTPIRPFCKEDNRYDFDFRITKYVGPKCLLFDPDFLFNIIENPNEAILFYNNSVQKEHQKDI